VDNAVKLVQSTFTQVGATRRAREFSQAALEAQISFQRRTGGSLYRAGIPAKCHRAASAEVLALADFNKAKATKLTLNDGTIS